MPVCIGYEKNIPPCATAATMHCHLEGDTHPPPPVPPFLLVQNLHSKRIAPTDKRAAKFG